ncbi:MAG: cystathionine gamma-synthase family protein [Flavobacteriales bacterium]|nr:cystathionine gamma-synthase family protein [Flavobacteriales bacterium]
MKKQRKAQAPESLMMSYGYDPQLSEGSIKCPIFQTSTFVFRNAAQGKAFFELAYGLREREEFEQPGLIYSRLNNPDLEILENRLALWDDAEDCAVFESGMSAITTCLMEFLNPGDLLLYSNPVYGGSEHFIREVLTRYGIEVMGFMPDDDPETLWAELQASGKSEKLAMVYLETPANPTNDLIDIQAYAALAKKASNKDKKVLVAVDNTYLGPLWQHPLAHGADLVLYSATKYIGGHSDVIAGACLGSNDLIQRVKTLRTFLGNMAGPWTGWLLLRSLETLKVRMEAQANNARKVADFLKGHPMVERLYYLGHLEDKSGKQAEVYKRQCLSAGAMLSFDIRGGEREAFAFLDSLRLIKLAVSLGGTESLAQHPASMTHAGIERDLKQRMGITDKMIRLSIGVENYVDLVHDISDALDQVPRHMSVPAAEL